MPPHPAEQPPLAEPPDLQHFDEFEELPLPSPRETIPQLDGIIASISDDPTKPYQCNSCFKELITREDFKWHFETRIGREDCRILKSMQT